MNKNDSKKSHISLNLDVYHDLFLRNNNGVYIAEVIYDNIDNPIDYRYLDCNVQFETMIGIKKKEIIGKTYNQIVPDDPESGWSECFKRVIKTKKPENYTFYSKIYDKYFDTYAFVTYNNYFAVILSDITEKKKAEIEREQFLRFFNISTDLMVIIDSKGNFRKINKSCIDKLGYNKDEILEKTFFNLVVPADKKITKIKLNELLSTGRTASFNNRFICKSEKIIWLSWNAVYSSEENLIYASARDISENKHIEEVLYKHQKNLEKTVEDRTLKLNKINIDLINQVKQREQAEMLAKESEERISTIFNNTNDLLILFEVCSDGEFRFSEANNAYMNALKYYNSDISREKLHGITIKEMALNVLKTTVKQYEITIAHYKKVARNKKIIKYTEDLEILGKNYCAEIALVPIMDSKNKVKYILYNSHDISELINTLEALKQNEERLQLVIEGANLGLWELNIKTNLAVLSDRALSMINYSKNDIEIVSSRWNSFIHPDDKDRTLKEISKLKQGKTSFYKCEHRLLVKNKKWKWYLSQGKIIERDTKGKPLKAAGIIMEINERKKIENELIRKNDEYLVINEELTESIEKIQKINIELENAKRIAEENENKFYELFQLSPTALSISTIEDGEIIEINENFTKIFGFSKKICVNKHSLKLNMWVDVNQRNELAKKLVKEGHFYGKEIKLRNKKGDIVEIEASATCVKMNNKTVVLTSFVDITGRKKTEIELKKAKEKAEESDRLKSAFLMNMSHEIRTPMNAILGFIDLLNEPNLATEERSSYLDIVNQSGMRLLNTINDIIEISKIEAGDINLIYEKINIADLMQYYLEFFKLQNNEKGLELILNQGIKADSVIIVSDKKKIDGILTNLIRNAIKFTNKGKIEIRSEVKNNNLIFSVIDTGKGIPVNKQKIIFERFVQADSTWIREHEGSGLGLSIVKGYVDALKGKIELISEEGVGSTFKVTIPIQAQNEL